MILTLLAGAAEYAAWLAGIYALASDEAGRVFYALAAWADRMKAKYDG